MQLVIKTALIVIIILAATALGKKLPVTAGLITVMPLTGALALVRMYLEIGAIPSSCRTSRKVRSGACLMC
jgi:hypothetical protein